MLTVKLTKEELHLLKFAVTKNQNRLSEVIEELDCPDSNYFKKMYKGELKKFNKLQQKLFSINIYL